MDRDGRTWTQWAVMAVVIAASTGCAGTRAVEPAAVAPRSARTVAATPPQVLAAAEQAFIELNLRPTSTTATARGGCALAQTAEGETITVTASGLDDRATEIRVLTAAAETDAMQGYVLESITAHLSVDTLVSR